MLPNPRALACVAISVLLVGSGCTKQSQPAVRPAPPPVAEAPPLPPPPPPPDPPAAPPPVPLSEEEAFARKTVEQLNAERPLGTVYFDYDRADLRDDARATLASNAEWLRRWVSTRIVVEGHCDERGTAEYNLALGDQRAQSVRAYLVSLGIGADRILATSKGEEAPTCTESHDACWQQNRRGLPLITDK
jgi:peptidoglycan-associated lipoprotein